MSQQSIFDKSVVIRNETQEYANTRGRVADVIDDLNLTKANKEDVDAAVQLILEEFDITEAEIYAYIDSQNAAQNTEINKKIDKPLGSTGITNYTLINDNGLIGWQTITVNENYIPMWYNNRFINSSIYQHSNANVGIGNSNPTAKLHVSGNIKGDKYYFSTSSANSDPIKDWTDGIRRYFTNSAGEQKQISFGSIFYYTPSGNFTMSQLKTAVEAAGLIFNGIEIFIMNGSNNYTCTIDNGAANQNVIGSIHRTGSGSISFSSTRTLDAGTQNVTILNGNQSSWCVFQLGTAVDFVKIRNY